MFLIFLDVIQALISAFCLTLFNLSFMQSQTQSLLVLRIFLQPINMTINFVNLLGLLYLFHCQGTKLLRRERKHEDDSFRNLVGNTVQTT